MCQPDHGARRRRAPTSGAAYVEEEVVKSNMAQCENNDAEYALTRKVVSHHNQAHDAWVIYKGKVHDITLFLEQHPGGAEILMDHLGTDVTSLMSPAEDDDMDGESKDMNKSRTDRRGHVHAHSAFAYKLLDKYKIGRVIDDAEGTAALDGNVDGDTGKALVRWDEPILHQVGMLGDKYERWIHSFPTTDHTVQMFTNRTVEALTKCAWYVPLVFWIPVIVLEIVHFLHLIGGVGNVDVVLTATMAALGMVCWLLFEYALHRWVFHMRTTSYVGNIVHFLMHGHHHITPMDSDRLVFPPVPAVLIGWPIWVGAPLALGPAAAYPWLIGFVVGYLVYDMTHYCIHHAVPRSAFLQRQKRRHVQHHYFRPSVNFGISNPLFDYVFGTVDERAL